MVDDSVEFDQGWLWEISKCGRNSTMNDGNKKEHSTDVPSI